METKPKDKYSSIKVYSKDRHTLKKVAALKDITMMEAFGQIVEKELERLQTTITGIG